MKRTRFRVFVIHSFKDMTLIDMIRGQFEQHPRIRIVIAERRRRPGDILTDKIMGLIENCKLVLVVWSHNLEKSIMAQQEIGYAKAIGKPIFPFVISGMTPKGFLEATEYMEFDPYSPEVDIRSLVRQVRKQALILGYDV